MNRLAAMNNAPKKKRSHFQSESESKMFANMTWGELAAAFTIAGVITTIANAVFPRIYGAGMSKVQTEKRIEDEVTKRIGDVAKRECEQLIREHTIQMADSLKGFREQLHIEQTELLKYKVYVAENFMPQTEYMNIVSELKSELRNQFGELTKRMSRVEDLVLNIRNDA